MGMQMSTPIGNQLTRRKKKHSDYQGKDWVRIKNKSKHYRTKSKNKKESDELVPRVSPIYANERTDDDAWSSGGNVEDYAKNGEIDAIARARVTIDQTVENTTTDGNTGDNNQYDRADDENYAITCTYEDHIYSPMVWTQACQPSSVGYGSSTEGLENAEEDRLSAHSATEGDRRSTASQDVVLRSEYSLDDFGYYNQHSHQKAINNQHEETKGRNSHEETAGRNEESTSDMNYINDPVKLAIVGRDLAKLQLNTDSYVIVPFSIETSVGEFCTMMSEDYGGRARIMDTDESEFNKRIMLKKLTAPFIIEFDGYKSIVQRIETMTSS